MLSPPKALDCLMLSPPTRLVRKKITNLVVFGALLLGVILIEIFITFPFLQLWQVVINVVSTFICIVCLTLSVCLDPGYLKNDNLDFLNLLEVVECT